MDMSWGTLPAKTSEVFKVSEYVPSPRSIKEPLNCSNV